MKTFLFSILVIALSLSSQGQGDNKIVIGKIDSIQSKILNEQRKIWVHVPGDGTNDIFAKQRYPVVYLLDGDGHFTSVVGMIQQLSRINGNTVCPEMIVVGITNTDRTRDLTPTHVSSDPPIVDSAFGATSGGGEQFISFMEKELMPYIESHYPTQPYKILIGHSLGGLLAMQVFIHHTNMFNAYVSIDPSMWWDHQKLLKESKNALASKKFEKKSLFLGIANTLEEGMNITTVEKDTSFGSTHIRAVLELKSYLEASKQNGLKYQAKYYADESHGSVPLISEYDALHFLFPFYELKLSFKDFTDSSAVIVDKYEKHFANVSKELGYTVRPPENQINGMGYQAMQGGQMEKAKRFFKYNIDNYPESFNVYDSMGDYYEAIGDKPNAIANFKKALTIREYPESRKKLERLQGK